MCANSPCCRSVCTGRKQYARALELLVQSLTAPTNVGSAITVAAYKQYVLVSLIHTGEQPITCCYVWARHEVHSSPSHEVGWGSLLRQVWRFTSNRCLTS